MTQFASLFDLARVIGAPLDGVPGDRQPGLVGQITTDSRDLEKDALFVALSGDRFDGHDFVAGAIAQGSLAAVVQRHRWESSPNLSSLPCLPVADTLVAYQTLGQWWRRQQGATVVAVTGSVGKTTTKELIAAALGTQGKVLKTQANYNNEIGVPKTLLQLQPDHRFAVIEMGMRGPGEIALLARIANPDVAVITNVGTAHIGRLGSEQAIAAAKCELLTQLSPQGIAILNHDNRRLMDTAQGVWSGRTLSFGLEGGDIRGDWLDDHTLVVQDIPLPLPLPGRHNALNFLAAIAVMTALDLDWSVLRQGLRVDLPTGRARQISLAEDIVLLDETYNAGFESMVAALQLLAQTPGQRRIAVLGTMKELGDRSLDLHYRIGATVKQLGIDRLLILADAEEAEALTQGCDGVESQAFADYPALVEALQATLRAGDRVLFKASRSVGLDRVVTALTS
ncbi:MAG: UDP-N-acetylmuramoyl-tripeptide--D-alanyl-D-alanine ligase [Nodosilinea sp.]